MSLPSDDASGDDDLSDDLRPSQPPHDAADEDLPETPEEREKTKTERSNDILSLRTRSEIVERDISISSPDKTTLVLLIILAVVILAIVIVLRFG